MKIFLISFSSVRVTYVVANIAVFYSKSAKMEIIYLQDSVKSTLKLSSLNVSKSAVETTHSK